MCHHSTLFQRGGIAAALVSILIFLSGCVHYGPVVQPGDHFTGLGKLGSGGAVIRVFMIHGMSHQEFDYADDFSRRVAAGLGFTEGLHSGDDNIVDGGGAPGAGGNRVFSQANIRVRRFVDSTGQVRLVFYAYAWSHLTDTPKSLALADDNQVPRAAFNGMLKTDLMNDGLSDAVLYMEHFDRDLLHRTALVALGDFFTAAFDGPVAPGRPSRTVFISESLGSVMLYDAIDAYFRAWAQHGTPLTIPLALTQPAPGSPQTSAADSPISPHTADCFAESVANTTYVYMFANQIQLLDVLANTALSGEAEKPLNRVERFAREYSLMAAAQSIGPSRVEIVDFSDPNDLLTYTLRANRLPDGVSVHNVAPHNDIDWLGIFERPDIAHTGYRKTVLGYILNGATAP